MKIFANLPKGMFLAPVATAAVFVMLGATAPAMEQVLLDFYHAENLAHFSQDVEKATSGKSEDQGSCKRVVSGTPLLWLH
jgi:hypothetical protein